MLTKIEAQAKKNGFLIKKLCINKLKWCVCNFSSVDITAVILMEHALSIFPSKYVPHIKTPCFY